MNIPKEEFAARTTKAKAEMSRLGLDALVVTDPVCFFYFTGQKVGGGGIGRPVAFVLPLEGDPAVVDWSGPGMYARLYHRPSPTWVTDRRIYPEVPFNKDVAVDWGLKDVLSDRGLESARIGIELGNEPRLGLGQNDFVRLQGDLPKITWVDSTPITWACRMIKSEWEISRIKKACEIGGEAWKDCLRDLHVGATQMQIQRQIVANYSARGADLDSGPPLVMGATGPNNAFAKGDILYLDGGCSVDGYKMDFTRRAVFGHPSERQKSEHDGMWDIMFKVTDRIRPGVSTAEVFEYSQCLLAKTNWTNYSDHPSKRIGHGIGLTNEPPYLNAFDQHVFEEGMSITPEPKIETLEGLLNAEEHVIVRENGCEIISSGMSWELLQID